MAKTSAERQAHYRATRHQGEGENRLNTWLTTHASLALARLAKHEGISKRTLLERLITEADQRVVETLDIDAPEWNQYFDQ